MANGTSSTKRIIWTEPSGQVAVLYPILPVEDCVKDVPDGLSYYIVEDSEIPKNTFFDRAWQIIDGKIEMDIAKAREVHKENIRNARLEKLAELDIEFQKAQETSADTSAIVAKKNALRDAPADSAIDAATDEAGLKAQWNTSILGTSPYTS
ncbi:hypothetical protein [uncultured Mediterranean phage uvMED]|nr:hypothetical protein [uncultured Mediterranean phage uvMED]